MAGHERERLCRGPVEPVRIVYDTDQRTLLGHPGQQAQHGQAHRETIRRRPVSQVECRGERVALRTGQALDPFQERRAQLIQPGERESHLGLHARGTRDAASSRAVQQVLQQRGLAHARLAAHHQDPALSRPHRRHEIVQHAQLGAPAPELCGACPPGVGCSHRPCSNPCTQVAAIAPPNMTFTRPPRQAPRATSLPAGKHNPAAPGRTSPAPWPGKTLAGAVAGD